MSRYAYSLQPKGRQKSFYGKAIVVVTNDKYENTHRLYSYDTQVACLDLSNKTLKIFGWYSITTSKHIRSFLNMIYGEESSEVWSVIHCAIKMWKCKSFKAFCDMNPTISTDSTFTIKASGKPTVNISNVSF